MGAQKRVRAGGRGRLWEPARESDESEDEGEHGPPRVVKDDEGGGRGDEGDGDEGPRDEDKSESHFVGIFHFFLGAGG